MNNPLISDYIDAIKSAEDNFEELSCLRPVLGDDGLPVMTSGNFAVGFKMGNKKIESSMPRMFIMIIELNYYGNKTNCE